MKVLFLSTWFPYPPDNGSKIRVYHLLQALGVKHRVSLLSFAFDTAKPEGADVLYDFCSDIQTIWYNPFERNRIVKALRFFSPVPIVTNPLPEMSRAVTSHLVQNKFDVIIASTEVMAAYALLAPPATIQVLEEHNLLTRWMWERYREQVSAVQRLRCWVSWQKARHYEAHLVRQFDLCTMVSKHDQRSCLEMLPDYQGAVEVVPNGVDCQHNCPGLAQPTPNTLIFNGALTYYANYNAIDYFLAEVYPMIHQQVPDVSLTITGSTTKVDLSGLNLDGSVHFSGYVDDIRPLVAAAWVCIVPVRQGGGTRLKILEAMALGTPVVSTSKGAEGLNVTNGHDILIADDPAEFASNLVALLRSRALRQQLTLNARCLVEQSYDWSRIGQRFTELVEDTASKRIPRVTSHDHRIPV